MEQIKITIVVSAIFLAVGVAGCATSGGAGASADSKESASSTTAVDVENPTISLADYLRRVPGVNVRGSGSNVQIVIQGVNTFIG